MRIGVFVGSFNPVHKGHIKVANYLLDNDYVDKVIMLPTPNYWHKNNLLDVKKRVEMLKFYESEKIIIDDKNNKYKYTYQVLLSLEKEYPNDELFLIIGSDNIEKLHLWDNISILFRFKVIVLRRDKTERNEYLKKYEKNFIYVDNFKNIQVSSSEIRMGNYKNLDDKVKDYIIKNRLYCEDR